MKNSVTKINSNPRRDHLALSWSISRGRDTYGYNICRLDSNTARYRTMGGGYDMVGTVVGDYLESEHHGALRRLVEANRDNFVDCGYSTAGYLKHPQLYGLTVKPDGSVVLDGACGISEMVDIARCIGIDITADYNRRTRRNRGFFVSPVLGC